MTAMPPPNFHPMHFCIAQSVSGEVRSEWIATAAYFKAELRGFAPGHEAEDWQAAEGEIETRIANQFWTFGV